MPFHPNCGSLEISRSALPGWKTLTINFAPTTDSTAAKTRMLRSELNVLWADDPIETAIFLGLVGGLLWAPFWLGSNRVFPWAINAIWFPTLVFIYELSLLVRKRRHPIALKRLAIPAGLFALVLLWIGVQVSTWVPSTMVHPIWSMSADVLGTAGSGSISVNPDATTLGLMRLLTDASALWIAIQLCRNAVRAHLLLRAISLIVAIYSAYGLILAAFFGGGIPFFDVLDVGGFVRASFVNRNSFATYAGLGLVVTIALILRLYRHEIPDQTGLRSYRLNKLIEATGSRGWLLVGSGIVTLVALLGTVSRGGILAAALGIFCLIILSFTRQRRRRTEQIEAILFVTLALVAGFVFFGDLIVGRITASGLGDTSRLAVYTLTARSILDAPLLGFGYGTFADVFPMYRDGSISALGVWDKAHNTYLEVWQGLGLIAGTSLMAALALVVLQCFVGAIRRRQNASPAIIASAATMLVGLHAFVDFSLQIEAVTLTYMAILGAGLAQSESSRHAVSD